MEMIRIENLGKKYGKRRVFWELNASFTKGEASVIVGPSGCGKTTLLRLIAGFENPDSGKVFIQEKEASCSRIIVPPRDRGIGMVFQNLALWPHMTIEQHLSFALRSKHVSKPERAQKIREILGAVALNDGNGRYPSKLSGGEQQRLAIARALVVENPILLLDEPLSNIHAELRMEIMILLKQLRASFGLTMIYVTHNMDEARYMGDNLFLFENGALTKKWPK